MTTYGCRPKGGQTRAARFGKTENAPNGRLPRVSIGTDVKKRLRWSAGSLALVGMFASAMLLGTPAHAEAAPVDAPAPAHFGYFESESFSDVYQSIVDNNRPQMASALLKSAIEDPDLLPGLDGLSDAARAQVLNSAAKSAAEHAPLAAKTLSVASSGPGARILGSKINNGFSWQFKDRHNWAECKTPTTCEVNDWIDFTYTVDPGGSGSRILIQTNVWGSKLGSYMVQGEVYRNVEMIKLKATGYVGGPGQSTTTTLWMSPHLSLTGYKFFANVSTFVETPGINPANPESGAYEWRTGMTDTCSEPTPGAWRCIFLQ